MAYFPPTGSVVGFQSDPTKLLTHSSVSGRVTADAGIVPGSVVAFQGAGWSGSVAAVVTFPTNQNVSGSVVAFQGAGWSGSVAAIVTFPTNQNVSGSVAAFQAGVRTTSLVSTVPSSVIVGTSIFGQLPGGTAVLGSVAALQGTNPWVVNFSNSSIIAINAGSVITINPGSIITIQQANSIVGTYAEDAAHTTADKGVFTLGVRNDAVASFVGANLDYGPIATDAAGRTLMRPFAAEESRVEGYSSTVNVSVTTLVAAAGAGLRNYITDVMIANTGATTTLVTFKSGGGASILGYTIAPTGGGSNMIGFATPIRTGVNQTFDFQATSASSILYATVKGFKAP